MAKIKTQNKSNQFEHNKLKFAFLSSPIAIPLTPSPKKVQKNLLISIFLMMSCYKDIIKKIWWYLISSF